MPRGVAKHVFALSSRVFCVAIDCTVSTQHRAPHRAAPTRDSETRHDTRHDTACQLRTSRHVYSSVTSVTTWCAACPEDRTHALGFGWYAASRETAASAVLGGGAKDLRFTIYATLKISDAPRRPGEQTLRSHLSGGLQPAKATEFGSFSNAAEGEGVIYILKRKTQQSRISRGQVNARHSLACAFFVASLGL